ncbi:MAG: hypothetical protein ACO1SV_24980 [Fimbriimonas sp.]
MFRRLYWVTEFVQTDGRSRIAGVYTSIPDLIRRGLSRPDEGSLRITLTKLDSDKEPFGTWSAPEFEGLEGTCEQFIRTEEFSVDEIKSLVNALRQRVRTAA